MTKLLVDGVMRLVLGDPAEFFGRPSLADIRTDEVLAVPPSPCVYVMRGASGGPVKIGYATSAQSRLSGHQTSNWDLLEIVIAIRTSNITESRFHDEFDHCRVRGEWFRLDDDLKMFIRKVSAWHGPGYRRMFGDVSCSCGAEGCAA